MKRGFTALAAFVSFLVLLSSSVWEGTAGVVSGADSPSGGLYIATNAFPANSSIELTNLENERIVRVTVVSPLEAPGLLALVSREVAEAAGIPGRMVVRVRLSQATDPASRSHGQDLISGDPDFDPEAFVALNRTPMREEPRPTLSTEAEGNRRLEGGELIITLPRDITPSAPALMPAVPLAAPISPPAPPYTAPAPQALPETIPVQPAAQPQIAIHPDYTLTFVPAPARPPESATRPDLAFFIPPLAAASPSAPVHIDPAQIVPQVQTAIPAAVQRRNEHPSFSVPIITSLEPGKYYLQLAAFSGEDSMRNELAKISSQIPRQVMNMSTPENPLFRLLIGPLTHGESEAFLSYFRAGYPDVFIRFGR